ncbi:MAG TPA: hypothetical protein VJU61_19225 [Polyangiaceae bacterium]|nr:hypothetical protein [Polyangiaceae bacterium]
MSGRRAEQISAWGVTLYGVLLPFHAVGVYRARTRTGFELCDAVLVLAAPAVLLELWRWRCRWLASPVVLGALWFSLAHLLTEALDPDPSRARLLQALLPFVAVGGVASALWSGHGARVQRGVLWGGGAALAVAVVGYLATLGFGPIVRGAFVFRSQHPIFAQVPRMTGSFGAHAVWLGEYCLMLLAVAQGAGDSLCSRAARSSLGVVAAAALFLSFSFAWLGGGVLFAQSARFARWPGPWRHAAGAAFAGVFAVASWAVVVGGRVDPRVGDSLHACSSLDTAHHIVRVESPGVCRPIVSEVPYPHRLTLYELAHRTTLASVRAHPWLGWGHHGYRDFAVDHAEGAIGLRAGGYYREAVGLYASTLAHSGLLGAAGLGLLLFGLAQLLLERRSGLGSALTGRPESSGDWALAGSVALLLSATQTDLELRGPLWILLGLAVAGLPPPAACETPGEGGVSTGRYARNAPNMARDGD